MEYRVVTICPNVHYDVDTLDEARSKIEELSKGPDAPLDICVEQCVEGGYDCRCCHYKNVFGISTDHFLRH